MHCEGGCSRRTHVPARCARCTATLPPSPPLPRLTSSSLRPLLASAPCNSIEGKKGQVVQSQRAHERHAPPAAQPAGRRQSASANAVRTEYSFMGSLNWAEEAWQEWQAGGARARRGVRGRRQRSQVARHVCAAVRQSACGGISAPDQAPRDPAPRWTGWRCERGGRPAPGGRTAPNHERPGRKTC